MGRAGILPRAIGTAHPTTRTPVYALLLNAAFGAAAIHWFDTTRLITFSAIGAVVLYIVSMLALLRLRRKEPGLPRPYRAPFYPWFPLIALTLAAFALCVMV